MLMQHLPQWGLTEKQNGTKTVDRKLAIPAIRSWEIEVFGSTVAIFMSVEGSIPFFFNSSFIKVV